MKSIELMAAGFSDTVRNSMLMHLVKDPAFGEGFCEKAAALLSSYSQGGNDCHPAGRNILRPSASGGYRRKDECAPFGHVRGSVFALTSISLDLYESNNMQERGYMVDSLDTCTNGYEKRYCLFLDILGFQSHVDETLNLAQAAKRPMTFQKLRGALHAITAGTQYKDHVFVKGEVLPTSRKVSQFSDSIVISYLKNEPFGSGVTSIILDVHRLQLSLIQKGILLRGAITTGLLFHDEDHVFGPALIEAVCLEKLANYPRVILDRQVLEDADLLKSTRQNQLEARN